MAGERNASIEFYTNIIRPEVTVSLWLGGRYEPFTVVPLSAQAGPNDYYIITVTTDESAQRSNSQALKQAIIDRIRRLTLPYAVEGDYLSAPGFSFIQVRATLYDTAYDFQPVLVDPPGPMSGIDLAPHLTVTTIRPVIVDYIVTHAGVFGSATGAIVVTGRNGNNGVYTYAWADGPTTSVRNDLLAGRYSCVVTDSSGASSSVTLTVLEDDRLEVVVDRSENNVTLRVSGGRPPYAFLWEDGTTQATRQALVPGTYTCAITDTIGARTAATVTISPFQFYFSLNPILLHLDAGDAYRQNPASKPNLSFVCDVYIEPEYMSENFVRIGGPLEQPADRNGRTRFEVQALLDTYLQEHLPAPGQRFVTRADSLFKRFYLRSRERFGSPVQDGPQQVQQRNYVVLGGLDFFEYPARTWFSSYQVSAKPFLTWQPNDKLVHVDQPEYLYFMADSFSLASFKMRVRVACTDGSAEEFDTATYFNPRRYEIFCLPVGYDVLLLRRFESATRRVLSWSVKVINTNGVPQTEERRYRLDYRYYPQKRYFLYTNSLGGVNTLACTGDATGKMTSVQEEAERGPNPGYNPLLSDTVVLDRSATMVLNVSTGLLTRADMIHLQEFVLSRRVTMVRDGFYWPGKVKPKELEAINDADTTRSFTFDFELPRQRVFTPRLPATPFGNSRPVTAGEGGQL